MTQPKYDESRVTRLRASLQDSSIADLVDAAAMARYELETAKRIDALFSDALYQRRGEATILESENTVAEMSQGQTYEWDGKGLMRALHNIGHHPIADGILEEIDPPTETTVNVFTTKAKAWAKKRGMSEWIANYYTIKPTAPRWEYSDKAQKEEQA